MVVDESELFVYEKLFLILVMYCVKDFEEVVEKVEKLVVMGGIGYIFCLYIDQDNQLECVVYFGQMMKIVCILINILVFQGGIGDLYNFKFVFFLMLGCGFWGGNFIFENVGLKYLINKKIVVK